MRLQPAMIFGEHMVLQRDREICIWGTSCENDRITVTLNGLTEKAEAEGGNWKVSFPAQKACFKTELKIESERTSETVCFHDVAIGEVWLAGGQSNMEFLMKYERHLDKTLQLPDDPYLRCYTVPQSAFNGFMEIDGYPDGGYWRLWNSRDNRIMFSAVGAFMAMVLRKHLDVPVGIISCNWGGTPASAWTAMEDLKANDKLAPILQWHQKALDETDWQKYLPASEKKIVKTQEMKDFSDRFMMGEDMTEFFRSFDPSKLPKQDFAQFDPGYRSTVRPAGLYENMLAKVAPYGIRGFLWYQGEDDDARNWAEFYDESMKTMINSWRKLWKQQLPFFQIELAPFMGVGATAAKKYHLMRQKQHEVSQQLEDVHDICILDCGEQYNIHPRNKLTVGNRLGACVLKHVYDIDLHQGQCPQVTGVRRNEDQIVIEFDNVYEGLKISGDLKEWLKLTAEQPLDYEATAEADRLILRGEFAGKGKIRIDYCYSNWCVAAVCNSAGDPAFGFSIEV